LPGDVTDSQIVRHTGHMVFRELLEHGVQICEFQPTLNHQKIVVVDGIWSHIGSTNLDNRSFELNDEISLGILDEGIAAELRQAFLVDAQTCEPIELEAWNGRSFAHKVRDWLSYRANEVL
jgi:cardiolipin synthase